MAEIPTAETHTAETHTAETPSAETLTAEILSRCFGRLDVLAFWVFRPCPPVVPRSSISNGGED